jgi:hypothetical protein
LSVVPIRAMAGFFVSTLNVGVLPCCIQNGSGGSSSSDSEFLYPVETRASS